MAHRQKMPRNAALAPRVRRAVELVYAVEGVSAVRVWPQGQGMAIGVRGSASAAPADLVRRVEAAIAGLREPGEAWDVGVLDEASSRPPPEQAT
jgi:hypothetical protein